MKILFIGGTGTISKACVELAVARGHDVTVVNRLNRGFMPGTRQIKVDMADPAAAAAALGDEQWDVVGDFIVFTPEQLEQHVALFRGRVGQFMFISSASAYQRPVTSYLVTESTPLANPFWDYSRNKIACEEACCARCARKISLARSSALPGPIPTASCRWR